MELIRYPNPFLKRRALPVETVDDALREKMRQMFEIMYRERGIGLAAPQVGWAARLFVANTLEEGEAVGERVYINPEIRLAEGEAYEDEGCLSVPDLRGKVLRSERVVVRALGLDGSTFEEDAQGLLARVIQHEYDHLDGILFISRFSASERLLAGKVLKKLEKEYKSALKAKL